MSEDLHRKGISSLRVVSQGTDAIVDVGLEDDVLGLCLKIGESNRLLACPVDLLPLFASECGHWGDP